LIRKKHVLLIAKLAVGALVIFLILRQLTFDDEIVLQEASGGATLSGRSLSVQGEARIRSGGVWKAVPIERAAAFRNGDGSYVVESRTDAGLERLTGDALEFVGTATLVDASGASRTVNLDSVKVREDGKDPVRIHPGFKFGLRSILGRLDDRPGFAIGAFALMALAYATAIARWQLLLRAQGLIVSYGRALKLTFIGFFFNNVLPGLTGGDIVKAVMIAQDHPEERPAAVGTVIVDRVLGLLVLAFMSATVLLFTFDRYRQAAIAVFGFLGVAAMGLVLFFSRRVRRTLRLDDLLKRLPGASIMKKLDRAFFLYRSQKGTVALAVLLSVISHCGNIGTIYCFGLGIGLDGRAGLEGNPLVAYLATVPIILIVSSIPLLPGGWGVGEAAFAYFFRTVGIWNLDLSIALSVVQRTATLLFSLLGGVFFLTYRKRVMDAVHESEAESAS
jgi:glycosyltransferase 2 family protein